MREPLRSAGASLGMPGQDLGTSDGYEPVP